MSRPAHAKARTVRLLLALAGAAVIAGCTVGPDYRAPEVAMPAAYRAITPSPGEAGPLEASDAEADALRAWWVSFNDPALTALVDRALESNLDLESASARLDRSRAILGLSRAELLPSAAGRASASRSRTSEEVSNGPPDTAGQTSNNIALSLDASWEIDVFGGRRRAVQAALADAQAAESDLAAVRISVTGEVADAYLARLGALERLAIAQQTIASFRDTLGLTRARLEGGLVSELDAALAAADLDAALADLPAIQTEVILQENRLAALLAIAPIDTVPLLPVHSSLPATPAIDDRGLPVDLLRRRPDIIAAERRAAASSAAIGAEIAEYFPRISLAGDIGLAASDAGDLLQSSARTWAAGPTLRWRILDFARIDNAVAAARADERAAIADYRLAIVEAVRDVEDAAAQYDNTGREAAARATALASRRRALEVAQSQYTAGLSEFLPVLDAQRGVNQASTDLALARERHARAAVALFRALGGGWN